MNVNLDGSYAPSLMYSLGVLLKVVHCGVRLDVDNTLTDGTAAVPFFGLSALGNIRNLLLLHLAPSLLLH